MYINNGKRTKIIYKNNAFHEYREIVNVLMNNLSNCRLSIAVLRINDKMYINTF